MRFRTSLISGFQKCHFISVKYLKMLQITISKMTSTETVFGLCVCQKQIHQHEFWHARCPAMSGSITYIPFFENFGNFLF